MRSKSVTTLRAVDTWRRSLATGCWRSIRDRHLDSMARSISLTVLSPLITSSAIV